MQSKGRFLHRLLNALAMVVVAHCAGCASTRLSDTSRTGVEQLLVSHAIDSSLDKIEFSSLSGAAVFVDDKYLECVDKKYVVAAARQRAFQAGSRLVDKPEEADVVLELFCGAVGTDRSEGFIGVPAFSMPGPIPMRLPEIKLLSQTTQYGTAKIGVVAYDPKTRHAQSAGGLARSRSNNSNWSFLGLGPFSTGSVSKEVALARVRDEPERRISLRNHAAPANQVRTATTRNNVLSLGAERVQQVFADQGLVGPGALLTWPSVQRPQRIDR